MIDCDADAVAIATTLRKALSAEFIDFCRDHTVNPYKQPDTLSRMLTMLHSASEEFAVGGRK